LVHEFLNSGQGCSHTTDMFLNTNILMIPHLLLLYKEQWMEQSIIQS